jgi:hypothetical protein
MSIAQSLSFLSRLVAYTFMTESIRKYDASHTIEYRFVRIAHIFHFIIDGVSDLQELSRRHPNFLLCQFIQSLGSVLDIGLSQQLLHILFWSTISKTDSDAGIWEAHSFVPVVSPLLQ